MAFCANCNEQVRAGNQFCSHCGAPVITAKKPDEQPTTALIIRKPQNQTEQDLFEFCAEHLDIKLNDVEKIRDLHQKNKITSVYAVIKVSPDQYMLDQLQLICDDDEYSDFGFIFADKDSKENYDNYLKVDEMAKILKAAKAAYEESTRAGKELSGANYIDMITALNLADRTKSTEIFKDFLKGCSTERVSETAAYDERKHREEARTNAIKNCDNLDVVISKMQTEHSKYADSLFQMMPLPYKRIKTLKSTLANAINYSQDDQVKK